MLFNYYKTTISLLFDSKVCLYGGVFNILTLPGLKLIEKRYILYKKMVYCLRSGFTLLNINFPLNPTVPIRAYSFQTGPFQKINILMIVFSMTNLLLWIS